MTLVSHIVLCRDKARWVERAVRSVFAQTYHPMEIALSVQESRDETVDIVKRLAADYDGPNTVRVFECPDVEYRGMPGAIAHLNWLWPQLEGDIVIDCSADDYNEPERVAKTVRAFEAYKPSYVNTRVVYETPEGRALFQTDFPDRYSRFVSIAEAIKWQIGSSGSSAWSRDLYEKYGPLIGLESPDVVMPIMATMERGLYFLDETLHHHVLHSDLENTGLEGQMRGAEDTGDKNLQLRLLETNNWHNTYNWLAVLRRLVENETYGRLTPEAFQQLFEKLTGTANAWSLARQDLTLKRIEPMGMRV